MSFARCSAASALLSLAIALVCAASATGAVAASLPPSLVMPWFCTQRCGFSVAEIIEHADTLIAYNENGTLAVQVIAFERFNLGPNSALVDNVDLFDINAYFRDNATAAYVVKQRLAMISSYPYPPEFLDWMRQLFANPTPFITALITQLQKHQVHGVNVDFEPTAAATAADAAAYAAFLGELTTALGKAGLLVTVAAATWSRIWNMTAIALALAPTPAGGLTPGYATMMNTYTFDDIMFRQQLLIDLETFAGAPGTKGGLIVGLETWPLNFTAPELAFHFALLHAYGVCRVAVWDMPLPLLLVDHLRNFSFRCGLLPVPPPPNAHKP